MSIAESFLDHCPIDLLVFIHLTTSSLKTLKTEFSYELGRNAKDLVIYLKKNSNWNEK